LPFARDRRAAQDDRAPSQRSTKPPAAHRCGVRRERFMRIRARRVSAHDATCWLSPWVCITEMESYSVRTSWPDRLMSGSRTVFTPICRWGRPHRQSAIRKPHLWQSWSIAAAAGLRREPRWRSRQDNHTLSVRGHGTAPLWVYGLIDSSYLECPCRSRGVYREMTRALRDVVRSFDASRMVCVAGRKEVASG